MSQGREHIVAASRTAFLVYITIVLRDSIDKQIQLFLIII